MIPTFWHLFRCPYQGMRVTVTNRGLNKIKINDDDVAHAFGHACCRPMMFLGVSIYEEWRHQHFSCRRARVEAPTQDGLVSIGSVGLQPASFFKMHAWVVAYSPPIWLYEPRAWTSVDIIMISHRLATPTPQHACQNTCATSSSLIFILF